MAASRRLANAHFDTKPTLQEKACKCPSFVWLGEKRLNAVGAPLKGLPVHEEAPWHSRQARFGMRRKFQGRVLNRQMKWQMKRPRRVQKLLRERQTTKGRSCSSLPKADKV